MPADFLAASLYGGRAAADTAMEKRREEVIGRRCMVMGGGGVRWVKAGTRLKNDLRRALISLSVCGELCT